MKLTNLDISTNHRDREYWFMKGSIMGAFAYWVVSQSPYDAPDIKAALNAFSVYLDGKFPRLNTVPEKITYDELKILISDDVFESIPEIMKLNQCLIHSGAAYQNRHSKPDPDFDFIDLGALAHNIFYMLLREQITQG